MLLSEFGRQWTGLPGQAPGNDESGPEFDPDQSGAEARARCSHLDPFEVPVMSTVDMFYLGLVLAAFLGFAVVLAYYSHR